VDSRIISLPAARIEVSDMASRLIFQIRDKVVSPFPPRDSALSSTHTHSRLAVLTQDILSVCFHHQNLVGSLRFSPTLQPKALAGYDIWVIVLLKPCN
jgi:hypothetical protein